MSTITDIFSSDSARDASKPASSNTGLVIFRSDTKAIEVSDGTNYLTYNYDSISGVISNQYAVNFDGSNDYMSINDADIFSLGNGSGTDNAFSISAWFNADSIGTFYIATKDASGAREWAFRTISSQLSFFAFGTGGGYIGRQYTSALSTGQWYHVVVTYDGSKSSSGIKLYLDGSQVDNANYASGTYTAAVNSSAEVRVGALQVNSTYSDGKIDEVAIFNSEISSTDVSTIYNSGKPASLSTFSPVGWWRMGDNDGATGTTITDQTGSNNGTLTNGPTFHDLSTAPDSIYVA